VAGAANRLVMQTQPSSSAVAGVAFAQQPAVGIMDQFGNLRSAANGTADNATVVTALRGAGAGILQGTMNVTAANGLANFSDLAHNVATTITIVFSNGILSTAISSPVTINPAEASTLAFAVQPGSAVAGTPFGVQPVVRSQDRFGNDSAVGLPVSLTLNLSLTSGTGPLQGNVAVDIGTSAGNGVATFTDLRL